jgi:hypothetical protein
MSDDKILAILRQVKVLAREYYQFTGKPHGITSEAAEYEAARLLGLELTPARQAEYDAIEVLAGVKHSVQIKGRCIPASAGPGQRLGSIDIDKEWDSVMRVLLDGDFEASAIYEAERATVLDAINKPDPTRIELHSPRAAR